MRRSVLVPAVAALLCAGIAPAHAQYDSRGSTIITSPALGGGVTSPNSGSSSQSNPYASSPVQQQVQSHPLPASVTTRLDERVDQLEELVRQLTGKVEEANYKVNQLNQKLERMQADIDLRFKDMQGAGGAGAAGAAAASSGGDGKSTPPALNPPKGADAPGPAPGPQVLGAMPEKDMKKALAAKPADPQSLYDAAYAAAQAGDYATAQKGFQDFLDKNPTHQLAGNAQYWLGDIAYAQKDFGTAAATFLDSYKKYPKHPKAPDMIYKAGSSFGLLGKKKEACTAFAILFADQPNMPDRVKRAATAEKKKYDCK